MLDSFEGGTVAISTEKDVASALAAESARLTGEGTRPTDQTEHLAMASCSLWALVAIETIATNLAGVPLKATVRTKKGKVEDAPDSDLQALLDCPSDGVDGHDLIEQYVTYLEAVGSTFCAVLRDGAESMEEVRGDPAGFAVLRPTRIDIVPGDQWIAAYKYRVSSEEQRIPAENMIYARYFNTLNDFWGLPRMQAIVESVASDYSLVLYNSTVLKKHGSPSWFLESEQPIERTTRRRIEREYMARHGSVDKAGGVVVVDRGLKAKPSGMSPKDMEFEKLARLTKRRIFGLFKVPPALGGDFDEASELSNARSQRNIFYENKIQPLSRKVTGPFSTMARREYGEQWGVRFAWEEVDIIREEDILERKETREDFKAGLITRNEARQKANMEPLEDERGDEFFEPSPSPFAPSEPQEPPPMMPEMDGDEEDEDDKGAVKAPAVEAKAADSAAEVEQKARVQAQDAMRRVVRSSWDRRYKRWLPKTKGAVESFFGDEADRVLARVRAMLGDGDEGKSVAKDLSISPDDLLSGIFNTRAEADAFRKKIGPVFLGGLVDAGQAKLDDILPEDLERAFEESNARIEAAINGWTASRVTGIAEATQDGLRAVIRAQYEEGASSRSMQDAIADFFRTMVSPTEPNVESRAETIARTETATFLNTGGFEADMQIEDAGGTVVKSWLSVRDEIVRESHVEADSATRDSPIPMKAEFANGLRYPNDPAGPPEETINCRCVLIEEVTAPPKLPKE